MKKKTYPFEQNHQSSTELLEKVSPKPFPLSFFFEAIGDITNFTFQFFKSLFKPPMEIRETLRQSFLIGVQSLSLVGITAFIMGLVLTIQTRPSLALFGAESLLPGMIGVSIVREIGPVITAIICAGKVGSRIGAELASMNVTEQIDAMEVSGADPFKYLVVTRVLATTCMIPVLVIFADLIGFFGGFVGVNIKGDVSFHLFINQIFMHLDFLDVIPAVLKTFFFGLAIGIIACFKGFKSNKGTEGVGVSANSAVVYGSLAVFIIDMIAVQLSSFFIHH